MKLSFLYFSSTGNTDHVARYLARHVGDRFARSPIEIGLRSLEWQPAREVNDFDVLAIGFPVYAADAPAFVQAYLSRLPPGAGRGTFVFCTKGAFAGHAVRRNLARLAARGYVPLGGGSVLMPGTDGLAMVPKNSRIARRATEKDFDHLEGADRLVDDVSAALSDLLDGHPVESLRQPLPARPGTSASDRIWSFLYKATENYARSRFHADERCIGCGFCARICPVDNVELRGGRAHFASNCVLCMRCLHACPQEAIQIGKLTTNKFRWKGPQGNFDPIRVRRPSAHNTEDP